MSFIIVYVTHYNDSSARQISDKLLSEKLIFCYNLFPIKSAYWWQETLQKDNEWVTILKTTQAHWDELQSRITELHTYEVPCIIKIEVEANEAYEKWINKNVKYGKTF
ncbi:MAG: divalent-cation tolerance protein CutA [Saprospiraceae bacterium]